MCFCYTGAAIPAASECSAALTAAQCPPVQRTGNPSASPDSGHGSVSDTAGWSDDTDSVPSIPQPLSADDKLPVTGVPDSGAACSVWSADAVL